MIEILQENYIDSIVKFSISKKLVSNLTVFYSHPNYNKWEVNNGCCIGFSCYRLQLSKFLNFGLAPFVTKATSMVNFCILGLLWVHPYCIDYLEVFLTFWLMYRKIQSLKLNFNCLICPNKLFSYPHLTWLSQCYFIYPLLVAFISQQPRDQFSS